MKAFAVFVLSISSLFLSGCNTNPDGDSVVSIDASDAEMNAAMERARETFPQFLAKWESMPSDAVSVKVGLPTSDDSLEHIWFIPMKITDEEITGTCGNDAVRIPGLKYGDVRTFKCSEISDWMIMVGNQCYGGYTIRVMAKREPENTPPFDFLDFDDSE